MPSTTLLNKRGIRSGNCVMALVNFSRVSTRQATSAVALSENSRGMYEQRLAGNEVERLPVVFILGKQVVPGPKSFPFTQIRKKLKGFNGQAGEKIDAPQNFQILGELAGCSGTIFGR